MGWGSEEDCGDCPGQEIRSQSFSLHSVFVRDRMMRLGAGVRHTLVRIPVRLLLDCVVLAK